MWKNMAKPLFFQTATEGFFCIQKSISWPSFCYIEPSDEENTCWGVLFWRNVENYGRTATRLQPD